MTAKTRRGSRRKTKAAVKRRPAAAKTTPAVVPERLPTAPVDDPLAEILPGSLRSLWERVRPDALEELAAEVDAQLQRVPLELNEFGYDPWGLDIKAARSALITCALFYRYYFRVETFGIENVPRDRVLLIGNHAGQVAIDAAMIGTATVLEAEPPRIVRGMGEYWLPTVPFVSRTMVLTGSVVGTPKNCRDLLAHGEAVIAFPEGVRGMNKLFSERYQLQRFGLGFMRLALATDTPIVPVAVVGSEEQAPAIANLRGLARLFGMPAFPITITWPWLGPLGLLPLPTKYRIYFGEPMHFSGDPDDGDAAIGKKVDVVKKKIGDMLNAGITARSGIFT